MSSDAFNEADQCILEEIEALKAIMFSELDVFYSPSGRPIELQTTLYPSTADDTNQHYVCLQLFLKFPPKYPDQIPEVALRNPRGLGEDFIANALKKCHEKCNSFIGSPVIYEIIELLRESLTNSNRPTGHCTICLFDFHSEDIFTYTPCYHHFHSHCLSRFCENLQKQWIEEEKQEASNNPTVGWKELKTKQFTCPVCREVINVDLDTLKLAPPPYEVENFEETFQKDAKYAAWRQEMENQYQKQKAKGGIIDREAEDSRFLVVTDIVGPCSNPSASEMTPSPENDHQTTEVVASATNKAPLHPSKPDWSRGRGKWIHRPETHVKERTSASHVRPPSNPPRTSKKEPVHSKEAVYAGSLPAPCRPPPGFEPR